MSIRMIAIDLDGTLLHDDMTISSYSRDVIKKASEEGFKVVIATGRMWNSARKKMEVLELGNVPVVCYTGAWIIMGETGEAIYQEGMDPKFASKAFLWAKEEGLKVTAFWDDKIYMEGPDGTEIKYRKYRTVQPEFLGAAFFNPPKKVTRIVFSDPDPAVRLEIRKAIENKFGDAVDVVFPGDDFVDMHKSGINKATAVKYLADQAGISSSEIMAFGNTENDVPLLRMAGESYAVANADKIALDAAKAVCASNEEDGVAHMIEKLLK